MQFGLEWGALACDDHLDDILRLQIHLQALLIWSSSALQMCLMAITEDFLSTMSTMLHSAHQGSLCCLAACTVLPSCLCFMEHNSVPFILSVLNGINKTIAV